MSSEIPSQPPTTVSDYVKVEIEPTQESTNSVIFVKYSDIPRFLVCSAFYKSLNGTDEDDNIPIPALCYLSHDLVDDIEGLAKLLRVTMFWGIDAIPESVLDFCCCTSMEDWIATATNILEDAMLYSLTIYCEDPTSLENVNSSGRWEIFDHWMKRHPPESEKGQNATTVAATIGALRVLRELIDQNYPVDVHAAAAAAFNGRTDILRFLHERSFPWDPETCMQAAKKGQLECLIYARENGAEWSEEVTLQATRNAHFDVLEYALQHGCPIHHQCTMYAAFYDLLDCLQLLHAHHAAVDTNTMMTAAGRGHLRIVRFLFEHNCPYESDALVLRAAASFSSPLPCLQYLIEEQLLYLGEDSSVLTAALERADIAAVQYLLDHGCPLDNLAHTHNPWTDSVNKDNRDKRDAVLLECLQCASGRGWECSKPFAQYVLKSGLPLCTAFIENESQCAMINDERDNEQRSVNKPAPVKSGVFDITKDLKELLAMLNGFEMPVLKESADNT